MRKFVLLHCKLDRSHIREAYTHLALILEFLKNMICLCIIKHSNLFRTFYDCLVRNVDCLGKFEELQLQFIQFLTGCRVGQFNLLCSITFYYILHLFIEIDYLSCYFSDTAAHHEAEHNQSKRADQDNYDRDKLKDVNHE